MLHRSLFSSVLPGKYRLVVLFETIGKHDAPILTAPLRSHSSTTHFTCMLQQQRSKHSVLPVLTLPNSLPTKSSTSILRQLSSNSSNNDSNAKTEQTNDSATKSSSTSSDGKQSSSSSSSDSNEIVLTPGETVVAVSRLTMWAGIAVFATVCAYYIAVELIPT
jgi:hypothetical protein